MADPVVGPADPPASVVEDIPATAPAANPPEVVASATSPATGSAPPLAADTIAQTSPTSEAAAAADPAAPDAVPVDPQAQAVNDQLKACRENPSQFTQWTNLVTATEKLGDMAKLREVYDSFLTEFPLCYGYWKRYADAELRHGMPQQASAVFERGAAAVPYSVDLWGHYATFKQGQHAGAEEVRGVFEQGLAYVGTDYLAHALWDKYISFELSQSATAKVAQLYERIFACPIRELDRFYSSLREYAAQHPASALLMPEQFSALSTSLHTEKESAAAAQQAQAGPQLDASQAAGAADPVAGNANGRPDTDTVMLPAQNGTVPGATADGAAPAVAADAAAAATNADGAGHATADASTATAATPTSKADASTLGAVPVAEPQAATDTTPTQMEVDTFPAADGIGALTDAAAASHAVVPEAVAVAAVPMPLVEVSDQDVKARWLDGQDAVYQNGIVKCHVTIGNMQATKQELARRQPFETAIKRPYFHIRPLDAAQLVTWNQYLDYVEQLGDPGATLRLYERCLVACASYADYWIRYVRYLEASGDIEAARSALQRATLVHCKQQHSAHLFGALFEERHGNVDAARAAYNLVQAKLAPDLLQAIVQHASFERRQGARQAACATFSSAVEKQGSQEEGSDLYPFLVLQYAAFLLHAFQDAAAGRAIYASALSSHPRIQRLWEGAIHFEELVPGADRVQRVLAVYKRALAADSPALPDADREELSERSAAFADLYGDAATAEQAAASHAALLRTLAPKGAAADKKRGAEGSAASGGPPAKQAKAQASPQHAASGAAASSAPQQAPAQTASPYYGQPGYNYSGYYPSYPPAQQYPGGYPGYPGYQ